ncbi:MAG: NAD(P)H-hydrate epimerase [Pirellulaceae bacterium]|nr:NAD(P)H-hydrate epimerase [Pirellulaceae bacterium]
MSHRPRSRAEVREVDRRAIDEFGMLGLVLMENAGRGCVQVLRDQGCRGPVAIVCGKGNNAGDGFVIARHLDCLGIAARVLLLAPPSELRGDAAANFAILTRSGVSISDLSSAGEPEIVRNLAGAEWIVDALLGTGATGSPRPPLDGAIRAINAQAARKLAVDLPSGLDCDTGAAAEPTVIADHTCTFVASKLGFAAAEASRYLGQVHVVNIGAPRRLVEQIAG